ncbi:MAG: hypothetical protein V1809_10630 [Planctomycetota bacterium]
MKRNSSRRFLFLFGIAVVLLLFFLWRGQTPAPKPSPTSALANARLTPASSSQEDNSSKTIADNSKEDSSVTTEVASPAAPTPDEPLWIPDRGPVVERSRARAKFTILDSRNQGLDCRVVDLKGNLWRRQGNFWIASDVRFCDDQNGVIVDCVGSGGLGLEPGEYELEVYPGRYGAFRHTFHIAKDQRLESALQTPCWRRVIALRFVDKAGKPIRYLTGLPRFAARHFVLDGRERQKPHEFLFYFLETFGRDRVVTGGSGRGNAAVHEDWKYATDEGVVRVVVYAGAVGDVKISLPEELYHCSISSIESAFDGPEWNDYPVICDPVDDLETRLSEFPLRNDGNPGGKSWAEKPATPYRYTPDTTDMNPYDDRTVPNGYRRIIVTLDAPPGIRPRVEGHPYNNGNQDEWMDIAMRSNPAGWWGDVPVSYSKEEEEIECRVSFVDGKLFSTLPEVVKLPHQLTPVPIRRHVVAVPTTALLRLSPTLSAFADGRLGVNNTDAVFERNGDDFRLVSAQPAGESIPLRLPKMLEGLKVQKNMVKQTRVNEGSVVTKILSDALLVKACLSSDNLAQDSLDAGAYFLEPVGKMLVLRAVDQTGGGIPWVDGVVLPADRERVCLHVRDRVSAKDNDVVAELQRILPPVEVSYDESLQRLINPDVGWDVNIHQFILEKPEDEIRRVFGNKIVKVFPNRKELALFISEGGWFPRDNRLKSDDRGYLAAHLELIPEKRYVLYLWSTSRDPAAPNKRLVFVAGKTVTDLGAIALPGW